MNNEKRGFLENKKGSHVGMILSFVIFITFMVFVFTVLRPAVNAGQSKQTILQDIEDAITANVSANFTSTSVQIEQAINPKIIAKNETQSLQIVDFGSGGDFGMLILNRSVNDNLFFRVYYSPEFPVVENTYGACTRINDSNYSIGFTFRGKYIFENKMYALISNYNANYEEVRSNLNVPPGNDFGFGFIQNNGTRIDVGTTGKQNVYSEEIPIQYIDSYANTLSGFINVRVW